MEFKELQRLTFKKLLEIEQHDIIQNLQQQIADMEQDEINVRVELDEHEVIDIQDMDVSEEPKEGQFGFALNLKKRI